MLRPARRSGRTRPGCPPSSSRSRAFVAPGRDEDVARLPPPRRARSRGHAPRVSLRRDPHQALEVRDGVRDIGGDALREARRRSWGAKTRRYGESRSEPAGRLATVRRVAEAVVEPERAALPELDGVGTIRKPPQNDGRGTASPGYSTSKSREARHQLVAGREHRALPRCPRAEASLTWAGREVRVGLGVRGRLPPNPSRRSAGRAPSTGARTRPMGYRPGDAPSGSRGWCRR